jgi:hypothetical protein
MAESVLAAAATATAIVASTVLAIAATVMTLSLTLAAIARGKRRSRGRWHRGVVGVECLRGRCGRIRAERVLLQD